MVRWVSASNTNFNFTWLPLNYSYVFVMASDNVHPGSSRSCVFRRNLQLYPRGSGGALLPFSDSTSGHVIQAGPAN